MSKQPLYDLIIVGAGAAGMIASIMAARDGKAVLLLESLDRVGAKLKATGGGRCNLSNTLDNEQFMASFGQNGRFMTTALEAFDHHSLITFFEELGVEVHAPDGFHIFPKTHSSSTIIDALTKELDRLGVTTRTNQRVQSIYHDNSKAVGVKTSTDQFNAPHIIIATGGKGYPTLGTVGDGYTMASALGHTIDPLYPAMTPLKTKERWGANCRADTLPKVTIKVDLPKAKKLKAVGDLIFTKEGIRGPVVLDFAREITPLIDKYHEVPLLINMTGGMNEEQIRAHLQASPTLPIIDSISKLLPQSVALELCKLAEVNPNQTYKQQQGASRDLLIKLLAWTPLTVTSDFGFDKAMVTRGGVSLKEVDPTTMQSRLIEGLYFCGEVINLDGPCGGYNLQWSFASGVLAARLNNF
jgi:predicted Rossmann fold flavoprotein